MVIKSRTRSMLAVQNKRYVEAKDNFLKGLRKAKPGRDTIHRTAWPRQGLQIQWKQQIIARAHLAPNKPAVSGCLFYINRCSASTETSPFLLINSLPSFPILRELTRLLKNFLMVGSMNAVLRAWSPAKETLVCIWVPFTLKGSSFR